MEISVIKMNASIESQTNFHVELTGRSTVFHVKSLNSTTFCRSPKVALRECPSKMSIARENSSVVWSRMPHIIKIPLQHKDVSMYHIDTYCTISV
jgi:hypothetical protein